MKTFDEMFRDKIRKAVLKEYRINDCYWSEEALDNDVDSRFEEAIEKLVDLVMEKG